MTEYRRAYIPGAIFTANLAERKGSRLLVEPIEGLRVAFHTVRTRRPFRMEVVVILPDHLHRVGTLPPGDTDYSTRWGPDQELSLSHDRPRRKNFTKPA